MAWPLAAQEPGQINIGVVVPDQMEGMEPGQIDRLRTKMEQICTRNGIRAGYVPGGFVVYPVFEMYEPEVIEGGMRRIYQIHADLTLFIKQVDGIGVASVFKQLRGNGTSPNQAVMNAIAGINVQDSAFTSFIKEGKRKISTYYEQLCGTLVVKADGMAQREEYDAALALLMSMPETVSCYEEITRKTVEIYNRNKSKLCRSLLNAAQVAAARKDYEGAARSLVGIDLSSDCQEEVQQLIRDIGDRIDAKEKQEWDFAMKKYNDWIEKEKACLDVERETSLAALDAAKELAKAYYANQPEVHYMQIVK